MVNIEIDGTQHQVEEGQNVLQACLGLGLDLPYFCWHPAMGSVGACRQCVVTQYADEDDQRGRLVVGCMTPVSDGLRISLENSEAREFRSDIIELLMTNHPHDCPVCEEGGQCHLQDMTVMTGHTVRKYRGKKRTHRNQYLGPFIGHEMNRCIACYRCVRYYQDYAGGKDLGVFGAHNHVYFGRSEDGVLENEFSGNLVEVCPTGVFTDKTYGKSYSRKWDLQTAPSICVHCSLGCNTTPGERYGEIRNVVNRYHGEINRYFLCDRGRFGYGFVNSEKRIGEPLIQQEKPKPATMDTAVDQFRNLLDPLEKVIGIGSPRASVEANFALRELVGAERFYSGWNQADNELMATVLEVLRQCPGAIASISQVEQADAILILGEDLTNTAPRLALAVRQAVRNAGIDHAHHLGIPKWQDEAVREAAQDLYSPLIIASCAATKLDELASDVYRGSPDEIARMGFAVSCALDSGAPVVRNISHEESEFAARLAETLKTAERPLVIAGTSCLSQPVIHAAANVVKALQSDHKALSLVVPECNSLGLAMFGGQSLEDAKNAVEFSGADTLVVMENDLYRRAERELIDGIFENVKHVVAIDHSSQATVERAELVLPCTTFAESEGTYVNNEGRAQRYFAAKLPTETMRESWQWLRDAGAGDWADSDSVIESCANAIAGLKGIEKAAPEAGFRVSGMKIPRQPHRYSGRTAMLAKVAVSEPKQPVDDNSALSFSMEGSAVGTPPSLLSSAWSPAWNSNHAIFKFQAEIGGHLQGGDPGVHLIKPSAAAMDWYDAIPQVKRPSPGTWLVVPQYSIFGSEPMSSDSPAVGERIEPVSVALCPEDLQLLQVNEGERVELKVGNQNTFAKARADSEIPAGIAALSFGFPGSQAIGWLQAAQIVKAKGNP